MDMLKRFNLHKTFLYPKRCPYCSGIIKEDQHACDKCKKTFPSYPIFQGVNGGYRCSAVFPYKGRYKRAVLNFKFHNKAQYSSQLSVVLCDTIRKSYPDMVFDLITFVPMHPIPLKKRGYNQSELLANELSKLMGIPCVSTLTKIKNTRPQHSLTAKKRRKNLKGAFRIVDKKNVSGRCVLIIDDVVTTGTTLGECAKTIQKGNPALICCATVLSTGDLY